MSPHVTSYSTAHHSTTHHSTAHHSTAHHSTTHHSTTHHSTTHHSTTHHSTTHHSTTHYTYTTSLSHTHLATAHTECPDRVCHPGVLSALPPHCSVLDPTGLELNNPLPLPRPVERRHFSDDLWNILWHIPSVLFLVSWPFSFGLVHASIPCLQVCGTGRVGGARRFQHVGGGRRGITVGVREQGNEIQHENLY